MTRELLLTPSMIATPASIDLDTCLSMRKAERLSGVVRVVSYVRGRASRD